MLMNSFLRDCSHQQQHFLPVLGDGVCCTPPPTAWHPSGDGHPQSTHPAQRPPCTPLPQSYLTVHGGRGSSCSPSACQRI